MTTIVINDNDNFFAHFRDSKGRTIHIRMGDRAVPDRTLGQNKCAACAKIKEIVVKSNPSNSEFGTMFHQRETDILQYGPKSNKRK